MTREEIDQLNYGATFGHWATELTVGQGLGRFSNEKNT
ncbi:MAG: hypothetical protein QG562_536 [Patescibacteria group bacterium]|nr:hypothetical protein [Patescibacteria group bacterium]MDQ5958717.1 hypothetical protein [Patescibacteria group bacterium]